MHSAGTHLACVRYFAQAPLSRVLFLVPEVTHLLTVSALTVRFAQPLSSRSRASHALLRVAESTLRALSVKRVRSRHSSEAAEKKEDISWKWRQEGRPGVCVV